MVPKNGVQFEKGEPVRHSGQIIQPGGMNSKIWKFLIYIIKVYQLHNIIDKQNGILNSWINIHDNSGETLEHFHNHTDFVVTSYLSLPEGSGYIEFRDPLEYHKANTYIQPELELWKAVPCKTNDILIFPGWLKHRTQPNLTNRRIMTMNIEVPMFN